MPSVQSRDAHSWPPRSTIGHNFPHATGGGIFVFVGGRDAAQSTDFCKMNNIRFIVDCTGKDQALFP